MEKSHFDNIEHKKVGIPIPPKEDLRTDAEVREDIFFKRREKLPLDAREAAIAQQDLEEAQSDHSRENDSLSQLPH